MEGLRLLKALLLSGPESCLAIALSHVPAVRRLTRYSKGLEEAVGSSGDARQQAPRVRAVAREVWTCCVRILLLVDVICVGLGLGDTLPGRLDRISDVGPCRGAGSKKNMTIVPCRVERICWKDQRRSPPSSLCGDLQGAEPDDGREKAFAPSRRAFDSQSAKRPDHARQWSH